MSLPGWTSPAARSTTRSWHWQPPSTRRIWPHATPAPRTPTKGWASASSSQLDPYPRALSRPLGIDRRAFRGQDPVLHGEVLYGSAARKVRRAPSTLSILSGRFASCAVALGLFPGVGRGGVSGRGAEVAAEVGLIGVTEVRGDVGPRHAVAAADRLGGVEQPVAAQHPDGRHPGVLEKQPLEPPRADPRLLAQLVETAHAAVGLGQPGHRCDLPGGGRP